MENAPADPNNDAEVAAEAVEAAPEPAPVPDVKAEPQPPVPDFEADPVARAALNERTAAEVARLRAEAEETRKAERSALEAQLRVEAEQRKQAEAAEADRQAQLSEADRLQEQIAALAEKDAASKVARLEAEQKAKAANERLDFIRNVIGSGKSLAKQDPALEDLAHTKATQLIADGKAATMNEAIAALAESDSYLFAAPAPPPAAQTSTAAGSSAPRGSVNAARPPSQGQAIDAWKMNDDEWGAYRARRGYMDLVEQTKQRIH